MSLAGWLRQPRRDEDGPARLMLRTGAPALQVLMRRSHYPADHEQAGKFRGVDVAIPSDGQFSFALVLGIGSKDAAAALRDALDTAIAEFDKVESEAARRTTPSPADLAARRGVA